MSARLWAVSIVYELMVAATLAITAAQEFGGAIGFAVFLGATGVYVSALLLVMGLIDYAKREPKESKRSKQDELERHN